MAVTSEKERGWSVSDGESGVFPFEEDGDLDGCIHCVHTMRSILDQKSPFV